LTLQRKWIKVKKKNVGTMLIRVHSIKKADLSQSTSLLRQATKGKLRKSKLQQASYKKMDRAAEEL
jgi:hypothetical protein